MKTSINLSIKFVSFSHVSLLLYFTILLHVMHSLDELLVVDSYTFIPSAISLLMI